MVYYESTSVAWSMWTTTSSTTSSTDVYCNWVNELSTATTSAVTSTTGVWETWTLDSTAVVTQTYVQPSPEERQAMQERSEATRKAREQAVARARKLLVESLTSKQRKDYDKDMSFIVYGQKSGNRYRINKGRVANVHLLNPGGGAQRRYCAHPGQRVPDEDTMLAQKLMLECNEDDFLRLANVS